VVSVILSWKSKKAFSSKTFTFVFLKITTMSTAQIIYEQYKVLPKKVREELKSLILKEDQPSALMQEIEAGLKEVKLMQEGKLPSRTLDDLKKELKDAQ